LHHSPLTFATAFPKCHSELKFLFNNKSTEAKCCALIWSYTGVRYHSQKTLYEKHINQNVDKNFVAFAEKLSDVRGFSFILFCRWHLVIC